MIPTERQLFELRASLPLKWCVPIAFAPVDNWDGLHSASITLLCLGGRQFGITNNHVIEKFEEVVAASGAANCYVGMAGIDPLQRLVDRSRDLDIAVLDLSVLDARAINGGAFKLETGFLRPVEWPPGKVERDELLTICGYPKATRDHQGPTTFCSAALAAVRCALTRSRTRRSGADSSSIYAQSNRIDPTNRFQMNLVV